MARNDRLVRLLKMVIVLQSNPGLTARELADKCGISVRQCYRDLASLQYAGVPIYHDNGYMMHGFKLKNISLTLEEALTLIYGLKLTEGHRGMVYKVDGLKEKLLSILPDQLKDEIEELEQRVEVPVRPGVDYAEKEDLFRKIGEAIRKRATLRVSYYSFNRDRMTEREIDPYQLVFNEGFWYLAGFCHMREEVRLFRVDRIKNLELTDRRFAIPEDFSFEEYMGTAWQMERGEEFLFRIRFFGGAARFVREMKFHPSQTIEEEPGGSLLFTAKASGMKSVARWILSFGSRAEVITPVELREMVKEEHEKSLMRYA